MRVFISQPMKDKTNEEIIKERERAKRNIEKVYPNEEIEIIESFFKDAPHDAKPLYFLAKSLELLSTADVAYFIGDWRNYRGCRIEFECATQYEIETMYE